MKRIILFLLFSIFTSIPSWATTWYVRDGGGTATQCTGKTNAVYPGTGTAQNCAFSHPRIALGFCTGGESGGPDVLPCAVSGKMAAGDTLNIIGDSDINPGQQAQYRSGYDDVTSGALTPGCTTSNAVACVLGPPPAGSDSSHLTKIIGIGTLQPQVYGNQGAAWIFNFTSGNLDIENIEMTQHDSCTDVGVGSSNPGYGSFPAYCGGTGGGYPFGAWAKYAMYISGTNITTKNLWAHNLAHSPIFFPGNTTNWNDTGSKFVAGGWYIDEGGSMTFGGNNSLTNTIMDWGGCTEKYPLPNTNINDPTNYYNCTDQFSGGLGGGFTMQFNGNSTCGNWTFTNSHFDNNTKSGIDFLHCNGTGTFNFYRSTAINNEGEALKFNVLNANIEWSQIISNAPIWSTTTYASLLVPYNTSNMLTGGDICRGNAGILIAGVAGATINILNNDISGNCTALVETSAFGDGPTYSCAGMTINSKNNKYIAGYGYDISEQVNVYYEGGNTGNGDGTCGTGSVPFNEDYNNIYNELDPSHCTGTHSLCGTDPLLNGEPFTNILGPTSYYPDVDINTKFNLTSSSPLIKAGQSGLTYTNGSSNDFIGNPSDIPNPSIGAIQFGGPMAIGNIFSGSLKITGIILR